MEWLQKCLGSFRTPGVQGWLGAATVASTEVPALTLTLWCLCGLAVQFFRAWHYAEFPLGLWLIWDYGP